MSDLIKLIGVKYAIWVLLGAVALYYPYWIGVFSRAGVSFSGIGFSHMASAIVLKDCFVFIIHLVVSYVGLRELKRARVSAQASRRELVQLMESSAVCFKRGIAARMVRCVAKGGAEVCVRREPEDASSVTVSLVARGRISAVDAHVITAANAALGEYAAAAEPLADWVQGLCALQEDAESHATRRRYERWINSGLLVAFVGYVVGCAITGDWIVFGSVISGVIIGAFLAWSEASDQEYSQVYFSYVAFVICGIFAHVIGWHAEGVNARQDRHTQFYFKDGSSISGQILFPGERCLVFECDGQFITVLRSDVVKAVE